MLKEKTENTNNNINCPVKTLLLFKTGITNDQIESTYISNKDILDKI